jgi:hypothetical protein
MEPKNSQQKCYIFAALFLLRSLERAESMVTQMRIQGSLLSGNVSSMQRSAVKIVVHESFHPQIFWSIPEK